MEIREGNTKYVFMFCQIAEQIASLITTNKSLKNAAKLKYQLIIQRLF